MGQIVLDFPTFARFGNYGKHQTIFSAIFSPRNGDERNY